MDAPDAYLERLSSADPTPGGGSAAAVVGAAGAALLAMVARITLSSSRLADRHDAARVIVSDADTLRSDLGAARVEDEAAYAAVIAAGALPRGTEDQRRDRTAALQSALFHAAEVPLRTATLASDVLRLADHTRALENANLASDVGCAAEFGAASLAAAALNVRVNHRYLRDPEGVRRHAEILSTLEEEARTRLDAVRAAVARQMRGPSG